VADGEADDVQVRRGERHDAELPQSPPERRRCSISAPRAVSPISGRSRASPAAAPCATSTPRGGRGAGLGALEDEAADVPPLRGAAVEEVRRLHRHQVARAAVAEGDGARPDRGTKPSLCGSMVTESVRSSAQSRGTPPPPATPPARSRERLLVGAPLAVGAAGDRGGVAAPGGVGVQRRRRRPAPAPRARAPRRPRSSRSTALSSVVPITETQAITGCRRASPRSVSSSAPGPCGSGGPPARARAAPADPQRAADLLPRVVRGGGDQHHPAGYASPKPTASRRPNSW
jgi:hypothetical protein